MRDRLFLLAQPFQDGGFDWYCNDCATLEAVLRLNPHWVDKVDIERVGFERPRSSIVELLGPDWQGCPILVMERERAPADSVIVGPYAILQDVRAIGRALTTRYGGVGPHP